MKILNKQHITLNKEAADVLEQAERAGWQAAHLWTDSGDKPQYYKWPNIGLWFDDLHIVVSPQPNYVTQTIFGYADIQYNHPIVSPWTVKQLIALIEQKPVVVENNEFEPTDDQWYAGEEALWQERHDRAEDFSRFYGD